jgi:hypothetical protein
MVSPMISRLVSSTSEYNYYIDVLDENWIQIRTISHIDMTYNFIKVFKDDFNELIGKMNQFEEFGICMDIEGTPEGGSITFNIDEPNLFYLVFNRYEYGYKTLYLNEQVVKDFNNNTKFLWDE